MKSANEMSGRWTRGSQEIGLLRGLTKANLKTLSRRNVTPNNLELPLTSLFYCTNRNSINKSIKFAGAVGRVRGAAKRAIWRRIVQLMDSQSKGW